MSKAIETQISSNEKSISEKEDRELMEQIAHSLEEIKSMLRVLFRKEGMK